MQGIPMENRRGSRATRKFASFAGFEVRKENDVARLGSNFLAQYDAS
jgi:hypothetical protein